MSPPPVDPPSAPFWEGPSPLPPHRLPEAIGPYRVQSLLGRGGMGVVYRARQPNPQRDVALKVLYSPDSNRLRRLFEREGTALARLDHPSIATVFEAGTAPTAEGEVPFIAMELVEGRRLKDAADDASLDRRARLKLIALLSDAVHHAHRQGVIHRDLKPANIMIDRHGHPKILDFGVARLSGPDIDSYTQTTVGELVGTIPYMSPEQVEGDRDEALDERSDVYSLGVIAFELITGRLPYDIVNKTLAESARIIRDEDPHVAIDIDPTLSKDLNLVLAKALRKEPSHRYQTAGELRDEIRRILNQQPIRARPPSSIYQLQKLAKRHRGICIGIVIAFAALLFGVIATSLAWRSTEKALGALESEHERALRIHAVSIRTVELLANDASHIEVCDRALTELLSAFRHLHAHDSSCPETRSGLAKVLSAQGKIALAREDLDAAFEFQIEALRFRETLAETSPGPESDKALSINLVLVGDILRSQGETQAAAGYYARAFDIDQDLVRRYPDDLSALDNLSWSFERRGSLYQEKGAYDLAQADYDEQHRIATNLVEADRENPTRVYGLSKSHANLAKLAHIQGDSKATWAHLNDAFDLAREAYRLRPYVSLFRSHLCHSRMSLARAHLRVDELYLARDLLDHAARDITKLPETFIFHRATIRKFKSLALKLIKKFREVEDDSSADDFQEVLDELLNDDLPEE